VKLKVYCFTGYRTECPPAPNGSCQTHEIVAASSRAEAARLSGSTVGHLKTYGSITGNDADIARAMAKPGVVHWRPLNSQNPTDWRELPPRNSK